MKEAISISKDQNLSEAEDYNFLLKRGLEEIEKTGSDHWTDYNTHDPGITFLQNIIFAKTELAFKAGMPIEDLLAEQLRNGGQDQAFFTAAEILTTKPVTLTDYRKLLIDTLGIRNAWLVKRDCACEMPLYVDCENDKLVFRQNDFPEVIPLGLYNVLLEPETDPLFGELNDGKLFTTYNFDDSRICELELRFPTLKTLEFLPEHLAMLLDFNQDISNSTIQFFNGENVKITTDSELRKAAKYPIRSKWNFTINGLSFSWDQVPLVLHLNKSSDLEGLVLSELQTFLSKPFAGVLHYQREKIKRLIELRTHSRDLLNTNRNLGEDVCTITEIGIEDIAVCADIQVKPDADIEWLTAQVYFRIEEYFNPSLRFYSLQEMQEAGIASEEIFNGPYLQHGFVKSEDLEASDLKKQIHTSDLINRLMEIEGIVAVRNFVFNKYNAQAQPLMPSEPWTMQIAAQHRAKLYLQRSKLLFFKNELPFLPANPDEVLASLQQLRSANASIKLRVHDNDLPIPKGVLRPFGNYFPVQFQLPITYGIGQHGLSSKASELRRAQAKQLKAYLMLFEQQLANEMAQVEHFSDLFSLDENQHKSYFEEFISNADLAMENVDPIKNELYQDPTFNAGKLHLLQETDTEGLERRSEFMDHQLARFAESFYDYALLLGNLKGDSSAQFLSEKKTSEDVFKQKVRFLKHNARYGPERFKAFNHHDQLDVTGMHNIPGLKYRIGHLLGLGMLRNYLQLNFFSQDNIWKAEVILKNESGEVTLSNATEISAVTRHEVVQLAYKWMDELYVFLVNQSALASSNASGDWKFTVAGSEFLQLAVSQRNFATQILADTAAQELSNWAKTQLKDERFFIVEHVLLRPKHYGMVPLEACFGPDCPSCDSGDPYSFRLTYVMPGWNKFFKMLDYRKYAERIIREETPAHLLPKICWLGNQIYPGKGDEVILCKIMGLLSASHQQPLSDDLQKSLCACATEILGTYNELYAEAVYANGFQALTTSEKEALFDLELIPNLPCLAALAAPLQIQIKQELVDYFVENTCKIVETDTDEVADDKSLCFQMNKFHKVWNEWLKEEAALKQDSPHIKDLIAEGVKNKLIAILFDEFSAVNLPLMKLSLNKVLLLFGNDMSSQLKLNLQNWILNDGGKPLPNNLLIELDHFLEEIICGILSQILEFFGDKLKDYLIDFAKYSKPSPQNATWLLKIEDFLNEVRLAYSNPLMNDATIFNEILILLKSYYQNIRKLMLAHARLVFVFIKLKSVYPPSTLHDCQDGDDDNPVSLNNSIIV